MRGDVNGMTRRKWRLSLSPSGRNNLCVLLPAVMASRRRNYSRGVKRRGKGGIIRSPALGFWRQPEIRVQALSHAEPDPGA